MSFNAARYWRMTGPGGRSNAFFGKEDLCLRLRELKTTIIR